MERLQSLMAQEQIPGLAFAVIRGQEILKAAGLGNTASEEGQTVTPRTLFRIGSVTKVLTSLAILRLVDEGQLDLDHPITHYIPWLTLSQPDAAERITLRMLLTHTSGLPTDIAERGPREPEGLRHFLQADLPSYPLVAPPGRLFCYSNLGFSLLGHVAEAVTGQTYPELMQRLVFGPLKMERTTLDPTMAMSYPLAQSYRVLRDGRLGVVRPFADNTAYAPAGFAFSTVLDLANLARMLLDEGRFAGTPLLSATSAAGMLSQHVPIFSPADGGRALGLRLEPHPGSGIARAGHMGGISGYRALFELYPDAEAAVIVLINRMAPIGKVRDLLLEEYLDLPTSGWQPTTLTPEPDRPAWTAYTGAYLSDTDGLARVSIVGGRLLLDWNGQHFPLSCHAPAHYVAPIQQGGYLGAGFLTEPEGEVEYLLLGEAPFQRIRVQADKLHPDRWKQYAGVYRLSQAPMTIRLQDGALFLHSGFYGQEAPCIPLSDTEFACKWGRFTFEFLPDGAGESVAGMRWARGHFVPRIATQP